MQFSQNLTSSERTCCFIHSFILWLSLKFIQQSIRKSNSDNWIMFDSKRKIAFKNYFPIFKINWNLARPATVRAICCWKLIHLEQKSVNLSFGRNRIEIYDQLEKTHCLALCVKVSQFGSMQKNLYIWRRRQINEK